MSLDRPDRELASNMELASYWIQEARFLAMEIDGMEDSTCAEDVMYEVGDAVEEIRDGLFELPPIIARFSGEGFYAAYDPNDGSSRTIFGVINLMRGKLSDLIVLDPSDIIFTDRSVVEDEDMDGGSLGLIDPDSQHPVLQRLRTPSDKTRLYMDFMNSIDTTPNQYVGGIARRSNDTADYHITDLMGLEIEQIEFLDRPALDINVVMPFLFDQAKETRAFMRSTRFRRLPAAQQAKYVNDRLQAINEQARVDRFTGYIKTEKTYISESDVDNRPLLIPYNRSCGEGYEDMYPLRVTPLRIDLFETHQLEQGSAVRRNEDLEDSLAGLYMVAEIDHDFENPNFKGRIAWIPIGSDRKRVQDRPQYWHLVPDNMPR